MCMKYFNSKTDAAFFAAFSGGTLTTCRNGRFKVEWKRNTK